MLMLAADVSLALASEALISAVMAEPSIFACRLLPTDNRTTSGDHPYAVTEPTAKAFIIQNSTEKTIDFLSTATAEQPPSTLPRFSIDKDSEIVHTPLERLTQPSQS